MRKIGYFLKHDPRFKRLKKPMEAASVCELAQQISQGRFGVISFRKGLLTLSVKSSAQAANLQSQGPEIIAQINQGLPAGKAGIGERRVRKIRYKIG